jgi:solute carrier family 25 protein 42
MDPFLRKTVDFIIHFERFLFDEIASRDVLISLACGGIAGVAAKTAVAPAERVKMSFQVSSEKFTYMRALARGNDMVKCGGITSLWKGHSTTIIRVLPFSAISFAVHDYCQQKFKDNIGKDKLPFELKFLAGSIAGAVATLSTYPLDVLRIRLALSPTLSWREAMSKGGMFQGLSPTMLGIIPYAGTTWMSRETLQEAFPVVFKRKQTIYENFVMNAIAG